MKKILSLLGTITLIRTSTPSLVACNKSQYSEKELADLKEKNNIKTKNGILEWIAPQEKPFNEVDNKWYFVVWRGDKNADWRIIKFQNNTSDWIKIDNSKNSELKKRNWIPLGQTLCIEWSIQIIVWEEDINNNYFKAVYRWNFNANIPNLAVDSKTGEIKVEDE